LSFLGEHLAALLDYSLDLSLRRVFYPCFWLALVVEGEEAYRVLDESGFEFGPEIDLAQHTLGLLPDFPGLQSGLALLLLQQDVQIFGH
jgi:hypothetical protein